MSPAPLSHMLFPNIRPMLFPMIPSASFPVAPQFFSDAYSLSLPSLVPSADIPPTLRNIHRVLRPNGTLHLTLIDPAPARATCGPRLQGWLDENLMLDLQRHFRCTSPTKLFPGWLADSGMRGEGSMITTIKFLAVTSSTAEGDSSVRRGRRDESELKTELRGQVGRMLWNEVWGQFIKTDQLWWEDPEIIEECGRLGTYWEFCLIQAVKQP
jgi:hypothetical protein